MSEQKFYITTQGDSITIREGKAPDLLPLKEPLIINLSGDIHSISNFLNKRSGVAWEQAHSTQKVDKDQIIVIADKKAMSITLKLDPENHYGATIIGKLEKSDELDPFGINAEKTFTRDALVKLIKFNRILFDDKEKHAALVLALSKIRLKTETELQAHSDNKGNRGASIEKKTINDEGFVHNFFMLAPIYKGEAAVKFPVEICYEASENGILFWLESPELKELLDKGITELFAKELESCTDYVIINK